MIGVELIFVVIFGLLIGSFINVIIYRVPREISVVAPRSKCTKCDKTIFWYENIPVLSYLFLRGKCSGCKSKISLKYPIVEILSGIGAFCLFPNILSLENLTFFLFFFSIFVVFIAHFFIDLEHQILPDSLNLYLGILFLAYALVFRSWQYWAIGFSLGLALPLSVTWVFYKIKGEIGLGGGDIKLFAALGLYLGPLGVVQNIFASCFVGALVGGVLILFKVISKKNPIPFGPFIISVAGFQIFFPKYWNLFSQLLLSISLPI